jgi:hypothetical protein
MTVEQVPNYHGTTLSLGGIFVAVGSSVDMAIGGVVLAITSSYQILGIKFPVFSLIAAGIYYFLTKNPCKPNAVKTPIKN